MAFLQTIEVQAADERGEPRYANHRLAWATSALFVVGALLALTALRPARTA